MTMLSSEDDGLENVLPTFAILYCRFFFVLTNSWTTRHVPTLPQLVLLQGELHQFQLWKCFVSIAKQSAFMPVPNLDLFVCRAICIPAAEVRFTFPLLCEVLTFSKAMEVAWWQLPFILRHRSKDVEGVIRSIRCQFPESCELCSEHLSHPRFRGRGGQSSLAQMAKSKRHLAGTCWDFLKDGCSKVSKVTPCQSDISRYGTVCTVDH